MENFENNMDYTPDEHTQPQAEPVWQHIPQQEAQQTPPAQNPEPTAYRPEDQGSVYGQGYVPQQSNPYHSAGVGRKESPFADSPYVMNHNPSGYYAQYQPQNPPKQPKPKKEKTGSGKKVWKGILSAVLVLTLVAAGCGITANSVNNYWEEQTRILQNTMDAKIDALEDQIAGLGGASVSGSPVAATGGLTPSQVYAMNVDAVVAISASVSSSYGYGSSAGSGFILSADGYVATNYHVIEGATSISVILNDGTKYAAKVIGQNSANDLAVLKVEGENLPHVIIGSSDDLIVGDQVVAVGNALGELSSSMTVGYISGKDRDVTTEGLAINMLQTDAAINSGNSGGPLFNMKGEVVGITSAKYSGTTSSGASIEGIGFAIPIDDVVGMISDLTEFGYITGAYLGVLVSDMDPTVSADYGLPLGAYVKEVTDGYCAQAAGVQAKDIIVDVGGYEVENVNDLSRALRNFKGGDTTTITVFRGGREVTLDITLDEKPAEDSQVVVEEQPQATEGATYDPFGFLDPFFGGNG